MFCKLKNHMNNQISISISQSDIDAVKAAIAVLETKLEPHLKGVSDVERSNLNKLGDKTQVFVDKAYGYASGNFKTHVGGLINVDEFGVDYNAFKLLGELNLKVGQIARKLEDSMMLSGAEALDAAQIVYATFELCVRNGVAGAQEAHNELAARYKRTKRTPHIKTT
ncbi:MAG: hypothetical protein H7296_12865 [Bacteroidia bacterium]|nr:hypothetical protein [Bacteroidia bacterium]